jgi:hypothetical protein
MNAGPTPHRPEIPRREIGTSGIRASLFSLGSWHTYDRMDFGDATAMLRRPSTAA